MSEPTLRRSTWAIPALLAFGSTFALLAALIGEGFWDWLAWALLAAPVVMVFVFWFGKSDRRRG